MALPKVYLIDNGVCTGFGDHHGLAVADDGEVLAEHICSSPGYFRHDLHDSSHRHEAYARKFGGWGAGNYYDLIEKPTDEQREAVWAANQAREAGGGETP